jgi:P-type E1-E2 ATPase
MSRAARHGIIVKTGSALEKLAEVQTVAFDKTGTLTEGRPTVQNVRTFGAYTKSSLLELTAAMEKGSNHVLATAIEEAARSARVKIPKAKNIREISGLGLSGLVRGKRILAGRVELLNQHNIKLPSAIKASAVQQTATWVAVDSQLAGIIFFRDEIRQESKATLNKLRSFGIRRLIMITGDNLATAKVIARKLGIKDIRAQSLPADKLRAIEEIKDEERPVAFVGDGVNDAPVLLASDIGIAIGARGETAASDSADMVILPNDIDRVAVVVGIAKRTFSVAKQSILGGIVLSIVLMLVFSTGTFKPIYGAVIQEGVDVIVIFNALRAHNGGRANA